MLTWSLLCPRRSLKPAFDRKAGTITAANASTISDGAAARPGASTGTRCDFSQRGVKTVSRSRRYLCRCNSSSRRR